jgi:3-hydroxybutyryl-CoA dehydrogenase
MSRVRVAAIGAGRMGRGIAHVFAYAGHQVDLIDLKPRDATAFAKLRDEALAEIRTDLESLAGLGVCDKAAIPTVMSRITVVGATAAPAALAKADVLFEGVPETLDAKREAFAETCKHARPDAIIASTTSTILVDTLAEFVTHKERFINAHWLNPAYLVPLVECSPGKHTAPETTARLKEILESAGKVPIVCAAAPGFIVPRIQTLAMGEAARIVEAGLATAEDVDKATRYGFGFRFAVLGLVEFIDYGGIDIMHLASNYLAREMGPRYQPPPGVAERMERGDIGLKSGKGYYDFTGVDVAAYRRDVLARFVGQLRHMNMVKPPVL